MNVDEIRQQYEDAVVDYREAVAMRMSAWRPSKDIEATIIVNGGYGEIVIDGKNAEQREAQLRLARNLHQQWVDFDKDIRYADAAKDAASATIGMCAAFLAYETALVNERAATGSKES